MGEKIARSLRKAGWLPITAPKPFYKGRPVNIGQPTDADTHRTVIQLMDDTQWYCSQQQVVPEGIELKAKRVFVRQPGVWESTDFMVAI